MDPELFEKIDAYPYDTDSEFQLGLASIINQAPSPSLVPALALKARCFYYSRKNGVAVDADAYTAWKAAQNSATSSTPAAHIVTPEGIPSSAISSAAIEHSNKSDVDEASPAFTYAQIVEMIQTGKEIPGIKEVPDTVLEGQGTQSLKQQRRKPWETAAAAQEPAADTSAPQLSA